jgi:hypothetical protein
MVSLRGLRVERTQGTSGLYHHSGGGTIVLQYAVLQYARVAGVHMEDLVDDELDLPHKLPGNVRYQGLKRKPTSRKKR